MCGGGSSDFNVKKDTSNPPGEWGIKQETLQHLDVAEIGGLDLSGDICTLAFQRKTRGWHRIPITLLAPCSEPAPKSIDRLDVLLHGKRVSPRLR